MAKTITCEYPTRREVTVHAYALLRCVSAQLAVHLRRVRKIGRMSEGRGWSARLLTRQMASPHLKSVALSDSSSLSSIVGIALPAETATRALSLTFISFSGQ